MMACLPSPCAHLAATHSVGPHLCGPKLGRVGPPQTPPEAARRGPAGVTPGAFHGPGPDASGDDPRACAPDGPAAGTVPGRTRLALRLVPGAACGRRGRRRRRRRDYPVRDPQGGQDRDCGGQGRPTGGGGSGRNLGTPLLARPGGPCGAREGCEEEGPITRDTAEILDAWRRETELRGQPPVFHPRFPTHGVHMNLGPIRHIGVGGR